MPANKTQPTLHSVELYLNGLADTLQKKDSWELYKIMSQCTGSSGVMWGNSIVGLEPIITPIKLDERVIVF